MPRERVHHGALYVTTPKGSSEFKDTDGKVTTIQESDAREFVPGEVLESNQRIEEMPSLDVTWMREPAGHVQFCFEATREWWERLHESYAKEMEENPNRFHYGAYSEVLTRAEINHLIKTLRRARDAAYGADA